MKRTLATLAALLIAAPVLYAGELEVTDVKALHRNGQTFVTWKDVAEGAAGARYQYSVYRSEEPITSIAGAQPCMANTSAVSTALRSARVYSACSFSSDISGSISSAKCANAESRC